jgi:ubiquinone/menaquinone biosynthesis C-methylase UbiE
MNPNESQPTHRFTGLAEIYARCRPDYPAVALEDIIRHCQLHPGALIVDVGCGTGISTRLFAGRGFRVIGIEPNDDMRCQAEASDLPRISHPPEYRSGKAEATGLPDGHADAVLAAQAFHWFEPETTLREFHRVLKPDGWVVLMWNERDPRDPFTAAYGEIVARETHGKALEAQRHRAGSVLLRSSLFGNPEVHRFPHEQEMDEEGMLGRAFSASYAPRAPDTVQEFAQDLRQVFVQFQRDGKVRLVYETAVYLGRRHSEVTPLG